MQQEHSFGRERPLGVLPQPHFDEEATLLSARPVIPLAVVAAKTRKKSWLLFSGSIALALLAGAAGAMLLSLTVNQHDEQSDSQLIPESKSNIAHVTSEQPSVMPDLSQTTAGVGAYEETFEVAEPKLEYSTTKPIKKTQRHKSEVESRSVEITAKNTHDDTPLAMDESVGQTAQERREERRPRRVSPSESESTVEGSSDDLFRIREIFEGPRRRRLLDRNRRDW